ncbi:MAG: LysR family transcriptional regulator [Streptosporangiales bacterium]|nr:LysR family transcriptional regulator [Streptosporangiales bacterium]
MDDLETRELRYFIAVAEELHFGRAAERLGIAQPPLSRAIQRLERRLGVPLVDRSGRRISLTDAGEVLLTDGRRALAAVAAAARRTQRAGRVARRLVLVMKPSGDAGLLPDILAEYEREPDAHPVDVVCRFDEREALLRDGTADLALLHRPRNDLQGFDTEELVDEGQVLVVSRDHRLAGWASVSLADLDDEPLPVWPGRGPSDGPPVHDGGHLAQLVALGRMVAVVPESAADQLRRDVVCVPVRDAPTTTLVLAWPEGTTSLAVAAFARAASRVAARRSLSADSRSA